MTSSEQKTCPHCGKDPGLGFMEEALIASSSSKGQTMVQCKSCGKSITYGDPISLNTGTGDNRSAGKKWWEFWKKKT